MAANVHAHEPKSKGQSVYVPVYSAIGFISSLSFDLAVTLSFRNVDGTAPITVNSAIYFDTSRKKKKDLLDGSRTLAPFGSIEILIKQQDFRGDIGGNIVVKWNSTSPVSPPLIEAIMVGARGSQAFSFKSRGIVLN
jgi:hypothetical protein